MARLTSRRYPMGSLRPTWYVILLFGADGGVGAGEREVKTEPQKKIEGEITDRRAFSTSGWDRPLYQEASFLSKPEQTPTLT